MNFIFEWHNWKFNEREQQWNMSERPKLQATILLPWETKKVTRDNIVTLIPLFQGLSHLRNILQ